MTVSDRPREYIVTRVATMRQLYLVTATSAAEAEHLWLQNSDDGVPYWEEELDSYFDETVESD